MRTLGFDGRVTLVGDEDLPPYDRPPLSKQVLAGARRIDEIVFADEAKFAEGSDRVEAVVLSDGTRVDADLVSLDDRLVGPVALSMSPHV